MSVVSLSIFMILRLHILMNVDSRHDVVAACKLHAKSDDSRDTLTRNIPDLYLTNPPPNAPHKAIQPEKIVVAGDSAGGGLCVALLTVLRDLGMAQPAGAVLISPWVDLTHSFPSVMSNTKSVSSMVFIATRLTTLAIRISYHPTVSSINLRRLGQFRTQ